MLKNCLMASVACLMMALPAVSQDAPTRDTVVATVNGIEITLGEMVIAASQLPQQYRQLPPDVLFQGVMDQLIQQQVLADTLTEDPARVTIALTNQRRTLLAGEVINTMSAEVVTDAALQAAYDATYGSAEPAREFNASHILVATEEEARAVLDRIAAGEDFAALAQELSTDTGSGAAGGELGWFGLGMMVQPFEAAVVALADGEPGSLSEPVQTQFGFHIVRLNETRLMDAPSLDEVRDELAETVRQQEIEARLTALLEAAEIVTPEAGDFDPTVIMNLEILSD
jgi:peptidyl-prolyl cis-trans isomerase C